jgi:Fe-S cluster biogenesis protein NfuA
MGLAPLDTIQAVLDEQVNSLLKIHQGRVDVKHISDTGIVGIEMSGGCQGCAMAKATMRNFVRVKLMNAIPCITDVIDVTNHKLGETPYFKEEP